MQQCYRMGEHCCTMKPLPEALYQCSDCQFAWWRSPGMVSCSRCKSNLVVWTNYEEWKAEAGLYPYVGTAANFAF